jgi:hypothetical protein
MTQLGTLPTCKPFICNQEGQPLNMVGVHLVDGINTLGTIEKYWGEEAIGAYVINCWAKRGSGDSRALTCSTLLVL